MELLESETSFGMNFISPTTSHVIPPINKASNVYFQPHPHGIFYDEQATQIRQKQVFQDTSQIRRSILKWFETWKTWQHKILLAGLSNRFSKSQLRSLSVAVESVFHRDFLANLSEKYPMKRVRSSIKEDSITNIPIQEKEPTIFPQLKAPIRSNSPVYDREYKELSLLERRRVNRSFEYSQSGGSSRNLSPIEEIQKSPTGKLPHGAQAIMSPLHVSLINEKIRGSPTSSSQSMAPSLSPIEEATSPLKSPKHRKGNPPSVQSKKEKKKKSHVKKKKKSENESLIRPDSKASIWEMGPAEKTNTDIDTRSGFTSLQINTDDFFSSEALNKGQYISTKSKVGTDFNKRIDPKKNIVPIPTLAQLYKPAKLWPITNKVDANRVRLKEQFREQLNQIWEWIQPWEEFQRVRLLLELLTLADSATVKYMADVIKNKRVETSYAETSVHVLSEKYWLNVFKNLPAEDLLNISLVSRKWHCIAQTDSIWIHKCEELGEEFQVPNIINIIEMNACDNETLDWKQAYFEVRKRLTTNASKIASILHPANQYTEGTESLDDEQLDSLAAKYKDYIPFWKLKPSKPVKVPLNRPQKKILTDKNKEELKDVDTGSEANRSDRCYEVDIISDLLSNDELEVFQAEGVPISVDYRIKAPNSGSGRFWLVDSNVLPLSKVQILEGHRGPVMTVKCHGKRIFSGGMDRKIRVWSSNGETFSKMEDCLKGSVLSMAVGSDEKCRTLYVASWDTTVSVFDCPMEKRVKILIGHTDTVTGIAVDKKYIVTCSHDGTVRVWSIKTGECLRIITHHVGAIQCLSYVDKLIITGGTDKRITLSDPDDGALLKTLEGHKSAVNAIERQRSLIVSGDFDGNVIFWSLDGDGKPMESVKAHPKQINDISFHGGRFYTASSDKLVKEWELMTMTCIRILQGHTDEVMGVQYTQKFLVTCSRDRTLRLWWWGKDNNIAAITSE